MYFPNSERDGEEQPYGMVIGHECTRRGIPFVINTAYSGHGVKLKPFLRIAEYNNWDVVETRADYNEPKSWKEARGKLEEKLE